MLQPINFIRSVTIESSLHIRNIQRYHPETQPSSNSNLDGSLLRTAYEEIIGSKTPETSSVSTSGNGRQSANQALSETDSSSQTDFSISAIRNRFNSSKKLSVSDLLLSAAENNLSRLSEYVSQNFDLNSTDMFGWTALMCASQKGNFETVRLLVTSGADIRKRDGKNQSAADLAAISRQTDIASYLYDLEANYEVFHVSLLPSDQNSTKVVYEPFFCQTCGVTFQETTPEEHRTSILHQLHTGHFTASRTVYGLPESNIGFRLMRQGGWNSEKGLGVAEDGRKYPIPTAFKRNRIGFGGEKETLKVTHYPHLMRKTAMPPANGVATKKDIRRRLEKTKQKRKEWGRTFSGLL